MDTVQEKGLVFGESGQDQKRCMWEGRPEPQYAHKPDSAVVRGKSARRQRM